MQRQWIVVADSATARIFSTTEAISHAVQVETLHNDKARMRKSELTSDKPGAGHGPGVGFSLQEADPKEHAAEEFARSISKSLNSGRVKGAFEDLVLVAPAHFLGMINHSLDKHTARVVSRTHPVDLAHESKVPLLQHITRLNAAP